MKYNKATISKLSRSGIGRELSREERSTLKDKLLTCYLDVAKVCEKYNLQIMLGGGSCLGAVRHNGFIPWDDDFDVNMPRNDFEKFKIIFDKELGEKYILNCPNYKGKSNNRFANIMIRDTKYIEIGLGGVNENGMIKIDLFTVENLPNNLIIRYIKGVICNILMGIAGCVQYTNGQKKNRGNRIYQTRGFDFVRLFIGTFFSFKSVQYWFNAVDDFCQHKKETRYVGFPTGRRHYFGEIHKKEDIFPLQTGTFEGYQVNLPNHVDKYLKKLYGKNYMQLPPEEQRERHCIIDIQFNLK